MSDEKEVKHKPNPAYLNFPLDYYMTWVHWYGRRYITEGYWPERWALVPVPAYIIGALVLTPLVWVIRQLISSGGFDPFEEKESDLREKVARFAYKLYDKVKVHCIDRFAVRFVGGVAKWPPVKIEENPATKRGDPSS